MAKWFLGRLEDNEVVFNSSGDLFRFQIDYLPKYIDMAKQIVLKTDSPLSAEQIGHLKKAWEKFNIPHKTIILEKGINIEID